MYLCILECIRECFECSFLHAGSLFLLKWLLCRSVRSLQCHYDFLNFFSNICACARDLCLCVVCSNLQSVYARCFFVVALLWWKDMRLYMSSFSAYKFRVLLAVLSFHIDINKLSAAETIECAMGRRRVWPTSAQFADTCRRKRTSACECSDQWRFRNGTSWQRTCCIQATPCGYVECTLARTRANAGSSQPSIRRGNIYEYIRRRNSYIIAKSQFNIM